MENREHQPPPSDRQNANEPSSFTHFKICSGTPLSLNCCGTLSTGFTVKHWMSEIRLRKGHLGKLDVSEGQQTAYRHEQRYAARASC